VSAATKIQWTDRTWNPVRGCALVSPGCTNCYAMKQAHRFSGAGKPYDGLTRLTGHGPVWTGRARFIESALREPLSWRKPSRVFVNSMSDLFHEDVTNEQIAAVFGIMAACPRHTFQNLTKRPERMRAWFAQLPMDPRWEIAGAADAATGGAVRVATKSPWPLSNVWLGVSVEDQQRADVRIPGILALRELWDYAPAILWLSVEPLLAPVDLSTYLKPTLVTTDGRRLQHPGDEAAIPGAGGTWRWGVDWVVVGGESGPGARECRESWLRAVVDQCRAASVPVFVKQMGAQAYDDVTWRGSEPRYEFTDRKGGDPSEWPDALRIREYPGVRP
jgi:protein gp37